MWTNEIDLRHVALMLIGERESSGFAIISNGPLTAKLYQITLRITQLGIECLISMRAKAK